MNLADALTSKTYTRGSIIIQQGDPADGMYFVETGEVSVTVVGNDGTERQVCTNISLNFQIPSMTVSPKFCYQYLR